MAILDDIKAAIEKIAREKWETTDGRVVPETEDIGLGNVGVNLEVTMLYADLADSTEIAAHSKSIAAEVYKAFLLCGTKLILHNGGQVRSFDGDRVMGVFIGNAKNTSAVKTAFQIKYIFSEIIVPCFKMYDVFKNGTLTLNYCAGVDTGDVLVARAGVRANNDLIWVGLAPNLAAKLSTLRSSPFTTYVTKAVYDNMHDSVKLTNGANMWEARTWTEFPEGKRDLYRSSWRWKP